MCNFVDWLTISQAHPPGSLPVVGSEFRISHSLDTGEVVRQQVIGFQHEGSFDTSLHVRSDGSIVAVSGNPCAYNRPDNLVGYASVSGSVDVVNDELDKLALPRLTSERLHESLKTSVSVQYVPTVKNDHGTVINQPGWVVTDHGRWNAHYNSLSTDERARISRLDITENIATSGAVDYIRHLSSYVHHGKAGYLYPNGRTVEWGRGSRRMYHKYYDKAFDIQQKIKKLTEKLHSKNAELIEQHIAYLSRIQKWCLENGVVRRETSFKSTELIDRKMIYIENWDTEAMNNVIRPYQFHKKLNIEETRFENISERLVSIGYSERKSNMAELIHTAWVHKQDYRKLCGKQRAFYNYRSMLLHVGVDIANPCDISTISLRAHRAEWKEIDPPSWYIMPGQDTNVIQLRAA